MTNEPKRGRGRPPRAGAASTDVVRLRVTETERETWQRAAGEQPLSEWIRATLTRAAARAGR